MLFKKIYLDNIMWIIIIIFILILIIALFPRKSVSGGSPTDIKKIIELAKIDFSEPDSNEQFYHEIREKRRFNARHYGVRAMRMAPTIVEMHKNGATTLKIAEELQLPPIAVLRQILLEKFTIDGDQDAKKVQELIDSRYVLDDDIYKHDISISEPHNNFVKKVLATLPKYETPESTGLLCKEPDAVFTGTFMGKTVNWLSIKNHAWIGNSRKLINEALRHSKKYGVGGFVFNGKLCRLNKIPGAYIFII